MEKATVRIAKSAAENQRTDNREPSTNLRQVLKAIVIGADPIAGKSKALPDDPFQDLIGAGRVIEPPFDLLTLAMLPENSSELLQAVEAMEINIEGFGFVFKPRIKIDSTTSPELVKAIAEERVRLQNFFNHCNLDDSFVMIRRKTRKDLETTGNGYWEIIANTKGEIDGLSHIPSHTMRLTPLDKEFTQVMMKRLRPDRNFEYEEISCFKRFRRFVQKREGRTVWFKEFGDPRVIDSRDGSVKDASLPEEYRANAVTHHKLYSPRTPYGLPRFIGNLFSIFGSRASEEINYTTFKNNNIPSMALLVSNGMLTDGSIKRIEEFIEAQVRGSDNYSKFLIIEAEPALEGVREPGTIKLSIQPLTQAQHKDALFQEYDANNLDKIRRAFRLPPIFVGRADDYTRATAESSRKLADEQIFAPEREEVDFKINHLLFPAMGIRFHTFHTNSPVVTDNEALARILSIAERTGGLTPNIARTVLSEIFNRDLGPIPEGKFDGDVPFSLTLAEAVKSGATDIQGAMLNQHNAALAKEADRTEITGTDVVQRLMELRRALEAEYAEHADRGAR